MEVMRDADGNETKQQSPISSSKLKTPSTTPITKALSVKSLRPNNYTTKQPAMSQTSNDCAESKDTNEFAQPSGKIPTKHTTTSNNSLEVSQPFPQRSQTAVLTENKIFHEINDLRYQLYNNILIEMNTLRHGIALWNYTGLNPILSNILSFNTMISNEIDYLNQRIDSISHIILKFVKLYKKNIPQSSNINVNSSSTLDLNKNESNLNQTNQSQSNDTQLSHKLQYYMSEYESLKEKHKCMENEMKRMSIIYARYNQLCNQNQRLTQQNTSLQNEVNYWKMKYQTQLNAINSNKAVSTSPSANGEEGDATNISNESLNGQNKDSSADLECYAVSIDLRSTDVAGSSKCLDIEAKSQPLRDKETELNMKNTEPSGESTRMIDSSRDTNSKNIVLENQSELKPLASNSKIKKPKKYSIL